MHSIYWDSNPLPAKKLQIVATPSILFEKKTFLKIAESREIRFSIKAEL